MQTANQGGFCLGLTMDSNENVTGAIPRSVTAGSPKRTWKDYSPPTSIRTDTTAMAESGNANSKSSPEIISKDATDTISKFNGSSSDAHNGVKLDQKFQITDGPVIRMGTGVLISRREIRNHPNSLPVKPPHSINMATWKDVSPPKDRKNLVDISPQNQNKEVNVDEGTYEPKNRSPIRTNPFHEIGTVYRGVDGNFQSIKRIKTDLITNPVERKNSLPGVIQQNTTLPPELASVFPQMAILTTWRDMSPTKSQSEGKKKRPESGYFSNDVQSEGGQESREGIDTSLSDSECSRKDRSSLPSEEGCFNSDYFYEDEFSVPFDTNLHQPNRQVEQGVSGEQIILPHSLNGSYTKFGGLRDSLLQAEMYLGPYESEMSGSRTSMEISSSEREMMCSSDMLNFSNDPLFTPSPPPTEQTQQQQQNVSVDSLSHQGHTGDMSNSRSSTDANLTVDCCIRKDAYFLSFNGSQEQRSTTESDISYASQTSSHDERQGGTQSDNSNAGDAEDECSNSFQFQDDKEKQQPTPVAAPPPIQYHPVRNMLLSRYPGRICLEALQEYLLDRSNSTKSPGSSRHSCSSHCKLSPLCGTLLSSGDLYASSGARRPGLRRSSNLTTWKQVKNLRKLGKEPNLHERSHSLPDLTSEDVKVVRRERPNRTLESMAESFHKKRHSDYVLEVYQQMLAGSNPPSPTTLSKIDQILFQEQFVQAETTHKQEPVKQDCMSCPSCGTQKQKSLYLDLRRDAQCGQSRYTAQTDISPQTLMLWHGQKNFSSQFPPNTLDCGIQTSIDEQDGPPVNSRSMQTSPSSPGTDLFHMLNELRIKEEHKSRSHERDRPAQTSLPRAKSATECRDSHAERLKMQMRRTVSLSPSRIGINSFYSHQSLPDLSFLSVSNRHLSKSRESSSSGISLFDPVQIPIILTPVLDDGCRSSQSRSSGSSHCGCTREPSQPPRRRRCGSLGRSSDPHSSGSNCSLSSSSGIDPNYVEPRTYTGLAPELEHLLFLPPHLESAYTQLGLAEAVSKCETLSEREEEEEEACEAQECSREGLCHGSPVKQSSRLDRYANEAYPSSSQGKTAVKTGKVTQRPAKCSSSGLLVHERLDALKEEKTPSPEPSYCHYPLRDYTDHRCFGCEECSEADSSSQELDEEKLQMYQQWLKDRKPPLKSCLRKRCDRDQKARSLSLDVEPDNPPEKPPRRPNRHSIACDGMFPVLVTEDGFECASVDPPPRCPPHHVEQVLPEVSQEKVVMRRKKPNPVLSESAEGSSQDEMNRAKRVSFASEVSFHSPNYTPQSSPRRQSGQAEVTAMELEENDILTLHVVRKERGSNTKTSDPGKETSHPLQLSSEMPPQEFSVASSESSESVLPELSPIDLKSNVLRGVIEASEALVRHFAQARDPFDKVRLGSFQETPAIGALVVTMLCPAIEQVVHDGLKSFLTGFHIFGKIHISTWRVAESSAEIGPYTRAINDLVKQLKVRPNVISHKQKFYAFLTGLLNLRLLDFWMGYISTKESIVGRFYDQNSILCLSQSVLERKYQDMLLALQPLSVLPFQIDYDIVSNYSLADSTLMGESDVISSSSAKAKVDLSSSPKVVVARVKNRKSASPDRSSWAGCTDHQDVYANVDKVGQDFSSTWDWIKTATIPKAKSLMSDIGLTTSSSGVSNVGSVTGGGGTKTSRLSQDLASVGIVTSRQNLSTSATSTVSATHLKKSELKSCSHESKDTSLPAVVMDHGSQTKVEDSARQRAEDILRRIGDGSPRRAPDGSPRKESLLVKKEVAHATTSPHGSPQRVYTSPQGSPEKWSQSGSPRICKSSPVRQIDGSPQRQGSGGSPQRGPLINPGSPKPLVVKPGDIADHLKRGMTRVTLDDFPENQKEEGRSATKDIIGSNSAAQSPLSSVSNLAQKWLPKKEEKVYREGKTDYTFDGQQCGDSSQEQSSSLSSSIQSPQSVSPQKFEQKQAASSGRSTFGGRLSGLKKLSPKGSFNIISFFDRLLLPSEKATTGSITTASLPTAGSSCDRAQKETHNATVKNNEKSERPPHQQIPPASGIPSNNAAGTSPPSHNPQLLTASNTFLRKGSKIPKVQWRGSETHSVPDIKSDVGNKSAYRTDLGRQQAPGEATCARIVQTLDCTPTAPEFDNIDGDADVDINANSPDYHLRRYSMFVDHSASIERQVEADSQNQSDGSGQSVSMTEDDQSGREISSLVDKRTVEAFLVPDFKYVRTLVSCDPDERDLLAYDADEYLEVLAQLDKDWLYCANGRCEGFVRSGAVKPLSDSEVFETLNDNFYQ